MTPLDEDTSTPEYLANSTEMVESVGPAFFRRKSRPLPTQENTNLRGRFPGAKRSKGLQAIEMEVDGKIVRALLVPKSGKKVRDSNRSLLPSDILKIERAQAKRERKAQRNLRNAGI